MALFQGEGQTQDPSLTATREGRRWRRFAVRPGVPDGTYQDVWAGSAASYPFPSSPVELEIVSGDAADAAGEPGAREVEIDLLDQEFKPTRRTVELDGLGSVAIPGGPFLRVQRLEGTKAGAQGGNVGALSLRVAGAGDELGAVRAGEGLSIPPVFTVPAGCRLLLGGCFAAAGVKNSQQDHADFRAYKRERAGELDSAAALLIVLLGIAGVTPIGGGQIRGALPEKTDFWIRAAGNGSTADVYVEILGILEKVKPS